MLHSQAWASCCRAGKDGLSLEDQKKQLAAARKRAKAACTVEVPDCGMGRSHSSVRVRALPLGESREGLRWMKLQAADVFGAGVSALQTCK